MSDIVILGGYGVFGSQVARELARVGHNLLIAGRDGSEAESFARSLGGEHRGLAVDVTDAAACRTAFAGSRVVVHCAGPFRGRDATVLEACLAASCHYVDISDDRGYTRLVRGYDPLFAQQKLAAIYGCSSLPGISGALALTIVNPLIRPDRARVTLFIGNNNPKGDAAVRSLLGGLGQAIAAPQGILRGFQHGDVLSLPPPFGRRGVFNFDSPEYDLLPPLLGVRSVTVNVGFELRLATYGLAALAKLKPNLGMRSVRWLLRACNCMRGLGTSGGVVMTELFYADRSMRRAALVARTDGKRMAALPAALAAHALTASRVPSGARTAYEALGARTLLAHLEAGGFELRHQ